MVRKVSLRVLLVLTVALVLVFVIVAIPTKTAHAASSITTAQNAACNGYYPPGARQPIRCYWSTVTEKVGSGTSWGCVNLKSNPFGYYSVYRYWYGWSYVDARGIFYVGWYGPVFKVGPYS